MAKTTVAAARARAARPTVKHSGVAKKRKAVIALPVPRAGPTATAKMDVGRFYAFSQCSLRMEAQELMGRDFELRDKEARKLWPNFQSMAKRNLGNNEKWVPFHTVLGVHELFLVQEVHHAKVPWWTSYHRFVAMFIFRSHCKRDLFLEVQMPFLRDKSFWKDPAAGFKPGSAMEKAVSKFRAQGRPLQTACFLIIPERLVEDDDKNLILNFMLRTQRLIRLADELWPVVNDKGMSSADMFDDIKARILAVKGLGDTWVKMLMVVIDIACPSLRLLQDRCEVGVGASDPMRKILEDEGLLTPKEKREVGPRREPCDKAQLYPNLKAGLVCIKKQNKQIIQVTKGMAGSIDRAHAIAEQLVRLANRGMSQEDLQKRRDQLFANRTLKVPRLGLDAKAEELLRIEAEKGPQASTSNDPTPTEALMQLRSRINASPAASSRYFWELLTRVETHGRKYFSKLPLVVKQMSTRKACLSCVTLQVQLCEFRQYDNFTSKKRTAEKISV
mmetsp:Transcript_21050/g.66527  ORF Transcript_21050/g.66527 Transcript_21050/m.66527 type:complete len:502 (-) Transcript_21050:131-1636(-)